MTAPWLDSHPAPQSMDWGGVLLGGLLALSLVVVLVLDHWLTRTDGER